MKTYSLPFDPHWLISKEERKKDYQDAFAVKVPKEKAVPLEKLAPLFFDSFPGWAMTLLSIRETMAGWVGLKTAESYEVVKRQIENFEGKVGESIALFHVKARSEEEILTGEEDKHLDFSLSFIQRAQGAEVEIILATTVQFNNRMGKLYFLPVKPIHKLLVPAMLKRMAKKLIN